jgi:hypothetical protein
MKRKKPSFNEGYYGFRTFSHLLEDAQRRGIVELRRDQRSGSYVVEDLGSGVSTGAAAPQVARGVEIAAAPAPATEAGDAPANAASSSRPSRRRRGRGRRARPTTGAPGTGEAQAEIDDGDEADEGAEEGAAEGETAAEEASGTPEPASTEEAAFRESPEDKEHGFSFFSWLRRPQPDREPEPPSGGDGQT